MTSPVKAARLAALEPPPQMPPYEAEDLPSRDSLYGPMTRARLRRTAVLYGLLFLGSLLLTLLSSSPGGRAFALGLMAPGGGFLYYATGDLGSVLGHLALIAVSLGLLVGAILLWVGSGNILAPASVWLGTAIAAASMAHHETWPTALWLLPTVLVLLLGCGLVFQRWRLVKARRKRERRQLYMEDSGSTVTPRVPESGLPVVEELTREDLTLMRFLLDRSLQPVDAFDGFEMIEQFHFSAARYAVFLSSYALSLTQYTRMPAFRGYLSQAQHNLIGKALQKTLWKYWRWENAWGNLRLGRDPIARSTHDDVMYTGWLAAMINFYASNTGDRLYNLPGSLTLEESATRKYVYDLPTLIDLLANNMARSEFCLIPCEPKFAYVVCNNFAGTALETNDRLYGTNHWPELREDFRTALDNEFMTLDGRLVTARSTRTGFGLLGFSSTMADAGASFYLHALFPQIARRTWEIVRNELLHPKHDSIDIRTTPADGYDKGNYKRSKATTLGAAAAAALEMGDHEVNRLLLDRIERDHPSILDGGVRQHSAVSVIGHAFFFTARASRQNGVLEMAKLGMPSAWMDGPLIEHAEYPRVLVAKAVSDGRALEAVLYPGGKGGRESIGLSQLVPHGRYRCERALEPEFTANAQGQASITFDLEDRTEIGVVPLESDRAGA